MGSLKNIHLYPSYITNETRILKECVTIVDKGLANDVTIIGLWKQGLKREERVYTNVTVRRLNCYFGKAQNFKFFNGFIFLIFYVRCILFVTFARPDVINCHALTILPLCAWLKTLTGAFLIYDPHELETETNDSHGIRRKISKFLERRYIRSANHIIVVSKSIGDWYKATYELSPNILDVVKNIPSAIQRETVPIDLRKKLDVPADSVLFIYQGYLSQSRGLGDILHVFQELDSRKHIVLMGYGPLEDVVKRISATAKNIHYLSAVAPNEVLRYTSGADVGIHIIPNTCLNHYYCLPNKIFEYLVAGIPLIVSDFPDIRQELENHNVAWFLNPGRTSLHNLIESVSQDEMQQKRENCKRARKLLTWEDQEEVYVRIFGRVQEKRRAESINENTSYTESQTKSHD